MRTPRPTPPVVLVVDDSEVQRRIISHVLVSNGFRVEEAESGEEALERAGPDLDLVVLDVRMPGMDGLEVCARLKSDPRTAELPVLQFSSTAVADTDKVRGLESGADAYLAHPVASSVLLATVNALLRIRQAERAVRNTLRQWQTTFDTIQNGIALLNESGAVLRCNLAMAELLKTDSEDIIGRSFRDFPQLAAPQPASCPFERMLRSQTRETATQDVQGRWFEG